MTRRRIFTRFEAERRDVDEDDASFTEHLKQCNDCRTIHAAHLRIARAIGLMHASATPSVGWEDRVLEKIADIEADGDPSSGDRVAYCPAAPQSETGQRRRRVSGES